MSRRSPGLAALFLCLFAAVAPAQPDPGAQPVPLDVREVAPGVLVFRPDARIGNPATIAILGDDETILLDASIPEVAPLIDEQLRARGAQPVGRVITSHAHRDHTDGLVYWTKNGARGVATPEQKDAIADSPVIAEAVAHGADPFPAILVRDSLRFDVRIKGVAVPVRVMRPPNRHGHTDGDLLVHLPTLAVLFVGDHYFYNRYPIIDVEGGGSVDGYLANLDWIATTFPPETRILPGHNAFAPEPIALPNVAEFRAWKDRIVSSIAAVDRARESGKALQEAVTAGLGEDFADLEAKPRYVSEERWIEAMWER